jgi:nitric oxide reductase large subunit
MGGLYHKLEWVRMAGDMTFILAGVVPIVLGALRSLWKRDLSPTVPG